MNLGQQSEPVPNEPPDETFGSIQESAIAEAPPGFWPALNDEMPQFQPATPPDSDVPWPDDEFLEPLSFEDAWPDDILGEDAAQERSTDHRPKVPGFEWRTRGLYKVGGFTNPSTRDDESHSTPPIWITPPFTLPALVRDTRSNAWNLLIAWKDLDGVPHEESLPFELISGDGTDLVRRLGQGGMVIPPEPLKRKALLRYLCLAIDQIKTRARLVDSLGWQGDAFVLPDGQTIGQTEEAVRYAGEALGSSANATSGTLQGWQQGVARYAVGNPRLAFGLACAFAGPLLRLVRPDGGGGFNLQGFSSKGKSTILEAAASTWIRPDPLPTWRATSNGLEGIAVTRNDGFLVLDELGQVDPKEAGPVAYMLANGSAKARSTREGANRPMKQWRLIFLSSGEQGLEDKLSEDGKRAKAGQEVRVPDIPCPPTGMFEDSHGFPCMGQFAEHLKQQSRKHYGHAARLFIQKLCDELSRNDALQAMLKEKETAWLARVVPPGVDPQVRRVAGRFALVAVAGELAIRMGILPWPEGEAEKAAQVCFNAWLDKRGFSGASEVHKGIEAVLAFLDRHGLSRFDEWGDRGPMIHNRAGTRKRSDGLEGFDFYLTPEGWKDACHGYSAKEVARACIQAGILEPDAIGKSAQSVSIPGHGKGRCYVIKAAARARYQEEEAA